MASTAQDTSMASHTLLKHDLALANRILVRHGVLDSFGHASVRSPTDPMQYYLSASKAPKTIVAEDIMAFDLDSAPVGGGTQAPLYAERFIHGAIYRQRPDVHAVVHSHSPSVIPFGVSGVALRPVCHTCSFIGLGVPLFDIRDVAGDASDLLIRSQALGVQMCEVLQDKPALLMRGHGAVTVGRSLAQAVARSIYMELNARLQVQSIALAGSANRVNYLAPGEVDAITEMIGDYDRAWQAWCLEEKEA